MNFFLFFATSSHKQNQGMKTFMIIRIFILNIKNFEELKKSIKIQKKFLFSTLVFSLPYLSKQLYLFLRYKTKFLIVTNITRTMKLLTDTTFTRFNPHFLFIDFPRSLFRDFSFFLFATDYKLDFFAIFLSRYFHNFLDILDHGFVLETIAINIVLNLKALFNGSSQHIRFFNRIKN